MSESDADRAYGAQVLEQLRRIQIRLDDLGMVQRMALLGENRTLRFTRRDEEMQFFLPYAATDLIQRIILRSNNFFEIDVRERCRRYIPQGASIIDAGANIGNHAVYFAKLCGAKKIFAFEPLRQTFKTLERNIQLNAPEKIQCFNFALGAAEGSAELRKYALDNLGATVLDVSDVGQYQVLPLDSFEFDALDMIKIDVEGAEVSVLEGVRQTLARFRPVIVTEILPETGQDSDEKLKALNYRRVDALSGRDFVYCHNG